MATLGETPLRSVSDGSIADLIINSDGSGYMEKKKLFGRVAKEPFSWIREDATEIIISCTVDIIALCIR